MEFKEILNKFGDQEAVLKELGTKILEKYPQSKNLVELFDELKAAVDSLSELKTKLDDALTEAETDQSLKLDLNSKVEASELYRGLSQSEKDKLTEYLVQNKADLADEATLLDYLVKDLETKDPKAIVGLIPKKVILDIGRETVEEGQPPLGDFDAYKNGMDFLLKEMADSESKKEFIQDLAKNTLTGDPAGVIRKFYKEAL